MYTKEKNCKTNSDYDKTKALERLKEVCKCKGKICIEYNIPYKYDTVTVDEYVCIFKNANILSIKKLTEYMLKH